jgi:hypothetical protein
MRAALAMVVFYSGVYDSEEEAEHEQFLQERREQELREQWARS